MKANLTKAIQTTPNRNRTELSCRLTVAGGSKANLALSVAIYRAKDEISAQYLHWRCRE
jgi:hypothetical protein